jgi:hypothetical protein
MNRNICVRPELSDNYEPFTLNTVGGALDITGSATLNMMKSGNVGGVGGGNGSGSGSGSVGGGSQSVLSMQTIGPLTSSQSSSSIPLNPDFHCNEPSYILSSAQLSQISTWLPDCHSTKSWSLKYSLKRDGACLETMLMLVPSYFIFSIII